MGIITRVGQTKGKMKKILFWELLFGVISLFLVGCGWTEKKEDNYPTSTTENTEVKNTEAESEVASTEAVVDSQTNNTELTKNNNDESENVIIDTEETNEFNLPDINVEYEVYDSLGFDFYLPSDWEILSESDSSFGIGHVDADDYSCLIGIAKLGEEEFQDAALDIMDTKYSFIRSGDVFEEYFLPIEFEYNGYAAVVSSETMKSSHERRVCTTRIYLYTEDCIYRIYAIFTEMEEEGLAIAYEKDLMENIFGIIGFEEKFEPIDNLLYEESDAEVLSKVEVEIKQAESGRIAALITNNSNTIINELELTLIYQDSDGKDIDLDSDGHDMILPGYTVVSVFDPPSGARTVEKQVDIELGVHSSYVNHTNNITIRSTKANDGVIFKITYSSSEYTIEELELCALLYKDGTLVDVTRCQDFYNVESGEKNKLSYSGDKQFDNYVIYFNQAHTF